MKFELRHTFACTPERLWEITEAPDFDRRLAAVSQSERELVEDTMRGTQRFMRRRITARRELPAAMKKVTGTEHIAWDQLTWRQPGSNDLRWEIVPMLLKDRFSGSGTTRVIVTAQGCERIIAGDITIRVPLLGSTMEKRIVDDVRESYEKAAAVVREVLKG